MDDVAKKLFVQLDDDFPGVRANALDALRDHLKKANQSFRDLLQQLQDAVSRDDYDKALTASKQQAGDIARLTQELADKTREAAKYRSALAIKINWRPLIALPLAPIALWFGYTWITAPPFPASGAHDLQRIAQRAEWSDDRFEKPFVTDVGGAPYWVMLRGTVDEASFVDKTDNPIVMRCLHVFAGPAASDSGQYLKPQPYTLFGFGWLGWPERLVDCRPAPNQKIAGH